MYSIIRARELADDWNDAKAKEFYRNVESNLPNFVRDLMHTNVCITNVKRNEHLFAANPLDGERRECFTSSSKAKYGDSYNWQLEFIDSGEKVLIRNQKYNEHLYFMDGQTWMVRMVRTWRSGSLKDDTQAHFQLEFLPGGHFGICSPRYREYLRTTGETEYQGRPIYATSVTFEDMWTIRPCNP